MASDDARDHGPACRCCGSTEQPLYPDAVTTAPVDDLVVRDSVVCSQHLVAPR